MGHNFHRYTAIFSGLKLAMKLWQPLGKIDINDASSH
jgi:hypothetical protein